MLRTANCELVLALCRLAALPPAHDQALRRLLLVPRLHPFLLAPRADDVASAPRAATVRMIDRIHHFAAHFRTPSEPARLACLPVRLELVLGVPHLADRGEAAAVHQPYFRRRHLQRDVLAFLRDDLEARAGRARQLPATSDTKLDVMHGRPERDFPKRDRVPRPNVRARTRRHRIADPQPLRMEDVALLTVAVLDEGNRSEEHTSELQS